MKTDELREAYLAFFESKGCTRRSSDVLVPRDDPTVLFTPAGMNQFKREFMGLGDPNFIRATTCQKCLRTGDIENVGKTGRHMTFFEMLGNFSFGDYFKREAIHWAWEFLTDVVKLPAETLTITVYLDDDEAFEIWNKEIKIPAERITRMGEDDNFWPAGAPTHGPNGVCGPCSEIFFHYPDGREVEIWNLVFTQFNRVDVGKLEPLPNKNIDTGMGLERAASCLQGVPTVFDNDVFVPLIKHAAEVLDTTYVVDSEDGIRLRRMADHARTLTFAVHENVRPGPEKQGYVLRRLLRRAVLDAYQMGRREPFLFDVVPAVVEQMKSGYPELSESVRRVQSVVRDEEERFLRTLENGLRLLESTFAKTKAAGSEVIAGVTVFDLQQTYGIPREITEDLAAEHNLSIDLDGFSKAIEEHARISRGQTEAFDVFATGPLDTLKQDHHEGTHFLGYDQTANEARVIGIIAQERLVEREDAHEGRPIAIVLDQSPFYGEKGGQVGDVGVLRALDGSFRFHVEDTQEKLGFLLHVGHLTEGSIGLGQAVSAEVDATRRDAIQRAHSATHVLHHALQAHLGKDAQQAGSKVEPDRLRFDFSNPESVDPQTLQNIEADVNQRVLQGDPIRWQTMPLEEAKALGAMALFGEKYPDVVRVVEMGDFSRELCGGTHLGNVGQVGLFKIIGEESVSAGTRRITALTGRAALELIRDHEAILAQAAATLKVPSSQVVDRIQALQDEVKSLKKQASQRKAGPEISTDELLAGAKTVGSTMVIAASVPSMPPNDLRQTVDVLRRKASTDLAAILLTELDGKVLLAAGLTPDVVERGGHAGNWLKAVAGIVGGGGGGKPDFAQAGGKQPDKIPEAVEHAYQVIADQLGV